MYNFDHILNECVLEKAANMAPAAKRIMYEESFVALNTWIETRLSKRKGAEIGPFGTFTWEIKTSDSNEIQMRPLFLISDSFVKDNRVRRQRIFYYPKMASSEEINYSKLAIKFSKNLTKDMVFCSLRDIFRKIGDFVSRGYEFTVPFTFGNLKCKERRVKFEFSSSLFPNGKVDEDFLAALEEKEKEKENEEYLSSSSTIHNVDSSSFALNTNTNTSENDAASNDNPSSARIFLDSLENDLPETNISQANKALPANISIPELKFTSTFESKASSNQSSPPSQRLLEQLIPLEPRTEDDKISFSRNARAQVMDDAFYRCLSDLEKQVINDEYTKHHSNMMQEKTRLKDMKKNHDNLLLKKEMQEFLDKQVHQYEERKSKERQDRVNSEITCIITNNSDKKQITMNKDELSNVLQKQIKKKEDALRTQKEKKIQEEREYLDHVAIEMDLAYASERAAHLAKQSTMLEAWEREAHVKNLKKLQASGLSAVKTYMNTNLNVSTNTARSDQGIGFDRRKMGNFTTNF